MKPLKLKKLILEVHETSIFIILIFKTTDKNTIITHVRHVRHELVFKIFANITRLKTVLNFTGIDPFSHKLSPGILDLIKIIIASFTLAPLRLYCIFNLLCLTWFVAKIGLLCTNNKKTNEKPFSGWRRVLQIFIRKVFRAVFFCMGFHSIKISGEKSSKEKAPILVCAPHATIVDAIAVFASGSVPVAKQGVAKMYFIGPVFSFIQSLFVTREAASSRQQTVDQIKSRACDLEAETSSSHKWPQVFIFPEGTCTNSRALIKFKSGAFQPGVPVQPVLIKRDLNTLDTLTWTWNQSYGELVCLWLTCCQFSNSIEIEFMKVYEPNLEEREDPRLFASNVRALMAARLGIPTVERSVSEFTNDGGSAWSINNQKTSSKVQEYPYVIDFVGNLTQT